MARLPECGERYPEEVCTVLLPGKNRPGIHWIALILLPLLLGTSLFAKKYPLTAGGIVPAAAGVLTTGHDMNGNVSIVLRIHHLAAPQNLSTSKNQYVVWIQHGDASPCKAGFLEVGKNLDATFRGVTPFEEFQLWVSAEEDRDTSSPRGPEVMKVSVKASK